MVQLSRLYITTGKTIALTIQNFVTKWCLCCLLCCLDFSRFLIAFLPRSKRLLVLWLQLLSTGILKPKKIKSVTVSTSVCHKMMGLDAMIFVFWMLNFKPAFSLSFLQPGISHDVLYIWASLVVQSVKNLPAVQETWVQFLGREDPLEKEMATHSSILAWKIPWTEEPGGLQSMGLQRVGHDWATNTHNTQYYYNGNNA